MHRGRPTRSVIRDNIVELLYFLKKAYGYEIHKWYNKLFPKCTIRVIYYHLKKGTSLKEFRIEKVALEKGDYSWGQMAEKIYYSLDENARPKADEHLREALEKLHGKRE